MIISKILGILTVGALVASTVFASTPIPNPQGHINDFANLYSQTFRQELEQDLTQFEQQTTAEVAVVTINSLGNNASIEEYAVDLFKQWGIGKKGKDNGVLLLIAKDDREARIEVGYGLEPVITDGRAGKILREQLFPKFKNNDYEGGTRDAIARIESYITAGQVPSSDEETRNQINNTPFQLCKAPGICDVLRTIPPQGIFFSLFIFGTYFTSYMARTKSVYAGGIGGGLLGAFVGWLAGGGWLVLLILGGVLGFLGLLLDIVLSRTYDQAKKQQKRTGFWDTWGGFHVPQSGSSGWGGSGGFGGFGGGGSGGGGASGKW